jgi:molybdenum cofactor biosynthesis protein B
MANPLPDHYAGAPRNLALAVLTVSDTRTLANDGSGALIVELAESAGHRVVDRAIVPDDPQFLRPLLETYRDRGDLQAVLVTGGTGISPRDQTFETVSTLLTRFLPGFGELFRMLSYAQVGPGAMLSRAVGGLMNDLVVLVMPGSRAAVKLAMEKIILPELPHLVGEARKGKK